MSTNAEKPLAQQCRESHDMESRHRSLTNIVESASEDQLKDIALDAKLEAVFRCAALYKYVKLKGKAAHGITERLSNPNMEPSVDVRAAAQHARGSLKKTVRKTTAGRVGARGPKAVKTRGAIVAKGGVALGEPAEEPSLEPQPLDPSERVSWLARLVDQADG